jgi:hypothetical protein
VDGSGEKEAQMAIQIEGKHTTLRWDDTGLTITAVNTEFPFVPVLTFEMNPEAAQEFTGLFTMGQHAISVGAMAAFQSNPFSTGDDQ